MGFPVTAAFAEFQIIRYLFPVNCFGNCRISCVTPADQVLPYMVRNTYRLPPTFFRTSPGTPSRIGPTHPTSVTSVPDLWILTPDTAPRISHDHCTPFIGMGLYAYL